MFCNLTLYPRVVSLYTSNNLNTREREFFSGKGLIQYVEDSTAIRNCHYLRETLYVHIVHGNYPMRLMTI